MEKRYIETFTGKRIVVTGPESTGKTALAQYLANELNGVFIPEYSREYVENLNAPYTYDDVLNIARKQVMQYCENTDSKHSYIFFDTFLLITKIWFKVVFNKVPNWLESEIQKCRIDHYLLCFPDLPWVPDMVRENGGEMRMKLFDMYKQELEYYNFSYSIIKGEGNQRFINAKNELAKIF